MTEILAAIRGLLNRNEGARRLQRGQLEEQLDGQLDRAAAIEDLVENAELREALDEMRALLGRADVPHPLIRRELEIRLARLLERAEVLVGVTVTTDRTTCPLGCTVAIACDPVCRLEDLPPAQLVRVRSLLRDTLRYGNQR